MCEQGYSVKETVEFLESVVMEDILEMEQTWLSIMEAFEFSQNDLFSLIGPDINKYYAELYNAMKNKNLRNEESRASEVAKVTVDSARSFRALL